MQAELVKTHRAAATTAPGFNDQFERRTVCEGPIQRWSPGERNLTFLDLDLLPLAWERKVTVAGPPDVLTARVDELEFQIVHRRLATYVKRELVVGRKVDRQRPMYAGIAGVAGKVEIEAQGLPREPF